ncbi:Protein dopey-2 [Chionoecetes opilio]|uniref:Protein dopey-2 n=1 Tax=Chionoecetes opilio TaxID=41210 RepID=A0A8J4Y7X3_CHIOP|nr:Protein dopey-2 [Chionoecetes opilio]
MSASHTGEERCQKELQEVSSKLLESCSNIAGSGLGPTTWLRRNLTVKAEHQEKKVGVNDASVYSVAALSVLAELLGLCWTCCAATAPGLCGVLAAAVVAVGVPVHSAGGGASADLLLDTHTFMMLPPYLTY